jgi:hypothetical protein
MSNLTPREATKKKISDFIFDQQFHQRLPRDLDAKLQIVGRRLAEALSNAAKFEQTRCT